MPAAAPAMHLGALHPETPVGFGAHRAFDGTPKAWPPGPALELGLRLEKWKLAASAGEDTLAMLVQQRAAASRFRGLMPEHLILSGCEKAPPFLVGLRHLQLLRFGEEPSRKDGPANRRQCHHRQ